ncbi:hypothetical protein KA977_12800, partial [Candidatus Dependentiae bacterium]|nr:hypothetical protein [Candidatus Dependentiae bacterium]
MKLNWSDYSIKNNDVKNYMIYRKLSDDIEFDTIFAADSGIKEFFDTSVVNDTYYYYCVSVFDLSGNFSGKSNVLEAYPQMVDTVPPVPVSNFRIVNGIKQIQLYWSPSISGDASYYKVYRTKNLSDTSNPNNDIATLMPDDTMYIDASNLDLWETYYYVVNVFDNAYPVQNSSFSEVLSGIAEDDDTVPPVLSGFVKIASDTYGIIIDWIAAVDSSSAITYKIYRNNILIAELVNFDYYYDSAELNYNQVLYYDFVYNYKIFAVDKSMNYSIPIESQVYFVDYLAPYVEHSPVTEITENNKIVITAKITDKYSFVLPVGKVQYYHSVAPDVIKEIPLNYSTTFTGEIPATDVNAGILYYRIIADDVSIYSLSSYYPVNESYFAVIVDKTPVLITDTSAPVLQYVQDTFVLTAGETFVLTVKAYDNSDSQNLSIKLYFGLDAFNEEIQFVRISPEYWICNLYTYNRNSGVYKFYISATDDSGNIGYVIENGDTKNADNPFKIKIWAKPENLRTVINYPNPWPDPNNPDLPITIRNLPMDKGMTIKIFTISGEFVRELKFGQEISG